MVATGAKDSSPTETTPSAASTQKPTAWTAMTTIRAVKPRIDLVSQRSRRKPVTQKRPRWST